MKHKREFREPTVWISIIPFAVLIGALVPVVKVFGADALEGGAQVALLFASAVSVGLYMLVCRGKWSVLEDAILNNIRMVSSGIIILLLIGAISGTWMISGIVPTFICYGIKLITPKIFLFISCLICALVSVLTGSSWTTIATVGVALLGIGTAQGYPASWVAGAIISGAYFGDKISPLSDTTTLAATSTGVHIFEHIRYMLRTTVPSFAIALVIYLVMSLLHPSTEATHMEEYSTALRASFNISPWVLIVPALTAVMIARKCPAMVTLFCAALMAAVAAVILQPQVIWSVATGGALADYTRLGPAEAFRGTMLSIYSSTGIDTLNPELNELVSTKGITGMLNTVYLIIAASVFGGVMMGSGMVKCLTMAMFRYIRKAASLVGSTVFTGLFCDIVTGDQYLSIILTGSLYKEFYEQKGYKAKLLSRSVEDSATVTSVLIPWNSCGMTQATVLHVATLAYLPFCFFNLLSPLMSIIVALFTPESEFLSKSSTSELPKPEK